MDERTAKREVVDLEVDLHAALPIDPLHDLASLQIAMVHTA